MADERRYQEDEIAEIFETAASPPPSRERTPTSADGLTLADLQSIGREVGVPAERIAAAASAIDRRRLTPPRRSFLGMPIGVGRSVDLPRAPTDREWEILVAELRETFHAQGRDASQGNLRAWRNGNLRALVEPTASGYRLRLGTTKGDAVALNNVGLGGILFGLATLVVSFLLGRLAEDVFVPLIMGSVGVVALTYNAVRLPGWAAEREQQMEYIAARALALLSAPADSH